MLYSRVNWFHLGRHKIHKVVREIFSICRDVIPMSSLLQTLGKNPLFYTLMQNKKRIKTLSKKTKLLLRFSSKDANKWFPAPTSCWYHGYVRLSPVSSPTLHQLPRQPRVGERNLIRKDCPTAKWEKKRPLKYTRLSRVYCGSIHLSLMNFVTTFFYQNNSYQFLLTS